MKIIFKSALVGDMLVPRRVTCTCTINKGCHSFLPSLPLPGLAQGAVETYCTSWSTFSASHEGSRGCWQMFGFKMIQDFSPKMCECFSVPFFPQIDFSSNKLRKQYIYIYICIYIYIHNIGLKSTTYQKFLHGRFHSDLLFGDRF